jgi:hypothetical protein
MNDPMGDNAEIVRAPVRRGPAKKKAKKKIAGQRPIVHADAAVTRQAPRPPSRPEAARDIAREPARRGANIAIGRDGEKLARRHVISGDPLDVPTNEIPTGWTYQWNTVTVLNRRLEEIEQGDLNMHRNGWRPVPASRHPGRWTPPGYEGSIIVDGMRLEERPESLTQDAMDEDEARARALVRDRTDALRMTQRQLPGAGVARSRGNAGGMKMDIDFGKDIPRPGVKIDDGSSDFEE